MNSVGQVKITSVEKLSLVCSQKLKLTQKTPTVSPEQGKTLPRERRQRPRTSSNPLRSSWSKRFSGRQKNARRGSKRRHASPRETKYSVASNRTSLVRSNKQYRIAPVEQQTKERSRAFFACSKPFRTAKETFSSMSGCQLSGCEQPSSRLDARQQKSGKLTAP
jgi:hypothetical protein